MEKNPATDSDGFPRPLPLLLTPFLPVVRADGTPPNLGSHPRRRNLGDGFIPVMAGAALFVAVTILALD